MRLSKDIQMLTRRRGSMRARDGAIIDPVVDEINGVVWQFQFRKATNGKYKWLALGRQEDLQISGSTVTPSPINTYVASAAVLTMPFSGLYTPHIDGNLGCTSAALVTVGFFIDGALTGPIDAFGTVLAAGEGKWLSAENIPREILAQHTVGVAVQTGTLSGAIGGHVMKVRPLRVTF